MIHKEIQNKLIFYLENSLTDEELKAVGLHLEKCEVCRFYLDELQTDLDLLKADIALEQSPYFYTRLKAQMEKPKQLNGRWRRVLQPAMLALFLLGGVIFGLKIGAELTAPNSVQQQKELVLLPFDGMKEEPIEQFLLTME